MNKQVIVIRKDLKMRRGKEISQGAHSSIMPFLLKSSVQNIDGKEFLTWEIKSQAEKDWLLNLFTKICVRVNSEQELLDIYNKAKEAGLLCALVQDAGHTEFHGVPTYTCCSIGPDAAEKIDPITGHLELL